MEIPRSPVDLWTAGMLSVEPDDLSQRMLEEYQLKEIRKMLRFLKEKSAFYREKLRDCDPETIRSMADFKRLPTTGEADLAGQEWRFQCVEASKVQRVVTVPTTGTTGGQKRIGFTRRDLRRAMEFAPYGFAVMCSPGDRVLVMMSGGAPGSIGDNIRRGIEPHGVIVDVYGTVTDLADAARHLCEFRPDVIVGVPIQMAALARYLERQGQPFQTKSVLLSADDVPESICRRLRSGWGCETFRHYGMTEIGMFGALECKGRCGYHLRACDHLFEVLDADEDGYGEIAVTTFHHEAMPLLRYRTGDIGRMTTAECRCQSPLARIEIVRGRRGNSVLYADGRVFLRDIEEAVFAEPHAVDLACAAGDGSLRVLVRTLPGDGADLGGVVKRLRALPALRRAQITIEMEPLRETVLDQAVKKRMERL